MFNIEGEEWSIKLVSRFHPKLFRSDGSLSIGACDDPDKTIYIYEGLDPQKMTKVLCHEITHAAMFSHNIDLDPEQEEVFADLLATYGQEIIDITNKIRGRY